MSSNDDLRLAWIAHRDDLPARRDALLTLAVASAGLDGEAWVERVRRFLVQNRPGHLYSRVGPVDESLSDPQVVAAIVRLRQSYPPARVKWLVQRSAVARGPFLARTPSIDVMVDDLLAGDRKRKPRTSLRLGRRALQREVPVGALLPMGAVTPRDAGLPESSGALLAFYVTTLLEVAVLCAIVMEFQKHDRYAA